jgi:phosphatidylserine/phosphatidylglycerophosphate/cardiolipin synthase-like enzyme
MHNKFIVIDGQMVMTGSANFTKRALSPMSQNFNYENIITLYNQNIVQKFRKNFIDVEKNIFEDYVEIVESSEMLPDWFIDLVPNLYQEHVQFQQEVANVLRNSNIDARVKQNIKEFFNINDPVQQKAADQITPKQAGLLRRKGVSPAGMSKKQASARIGNLIQQEKYRRSGRRG